MTEELVHINSWSKKAKCGNTISDDLFFGGTKSHSIEGKKFCTGCPVAIQCRTYALVHGLEGIWGGTTYLERLDEDPLVKDFLVAVYRQLNLLDHFYLQVIVSNEEVQQLVRQPVQSSPIAETVHESDPTLSQAS